MKKGRMQKVLGMVEMETEVDEVMQDEKWMGGLGGGEVQGGEGRHLQGRES